MLILLPLKYHYDISSTLELMSSSFKSVAKTTSNPTRHLFFFLYCFMLCLLPAKGLNRTVLHVFSHCNVIELWFVLILIHFGWTQFWSVGLSCRPRHLSHLLFWLSINRKVRRSGPNKVVLKAPSSYAELIPYI